MFAIQRLETILEILDKNGIVQVNELVKLLNVSDVTIRKDLNKLQRDGLITKTHGGAVLNKDIANVSLLNNNKITSKHNKKEDLAHFACQYVQKGDTIFLGSGYTCTALARQISPDDDVSIITNNIEAVQYLKDKCKTLILIGGEVIFHENHSFTTSTQINDYLKSYNINKVITSCSGVDMNCGISFSTEVSKNIISAILRISQSWYLLADQSKFNTVSPYKTVDIENAQLIVTDARLSEYSKFSNIIGYLDQ